MGLSQALEGRTNSLRSDKARPLIRASAPGAGRQASENGKREEEGNEGFAEFHLALDYARNMVEGDSPFV